jgi:hypothetical protein
MSNWYISFEQGPIDAKLAIASTGGTEPIVAAVS